MGTVAIGIRIGISLGSVETVLHIFIEPNFIRVGVGIGVGQWKHTITPRSTLQQLRDDASDTVFIENNVESLQIGFLSGLDCFNENSITGVIAMLTLTLGVNEPLNRPLVHHYYHRCLQLLNSVDYKCATIGITK